MRQLNLRTCHRSSVYALDQGMDEPTFLIGLLNFSSNTEHMEAAVNWMFHPSGTLALQGLELGGTTIPRHLAIEHHLS